MFVVCSTTFVQFFIINFKCNKCAKAWEQGYILHSAHTGYLHVQYHYTRLLMQTGPIVVFLSHKCAKAWEQGYILHVQYHYGCCVHCTRLLMHTGP